MVVENKLGRTIRSLRRKHKMSQVKLATKLGVHYKTIGEWELGRTVPAERYLMQFKGIFRLSDNEYEVLTLGLIRKRPITPDNLKKARRERLDALEEIGNTKIADLDDNDPRLIKLKMAVGAL